MPFVGTGNSLVCSQSLLPIITNWNIRLWSRAILRYWMSEVWYQQGVVPALTVVQGVLSSRLFLCARGIQISTTALRYHTFSWRCWSFIVSVIICCWCLASITELPASQFQSQFLSMMGIIVAEARRALWEGSRFPWRCFGFYSISIYRKSVVFEGEIHSSTLLV